MTNFDPTGTITLASADAALAYALSPTVQLDLGANFGPTRHTADKEIYVGESFRSRGYFAARSADGLGDILRIDP